MNEVLLIAVTTRAIDGTKTVIALWKSCNTLLMYMLLMFAELG